MPAILVVLAAGDACGRGEGNCPFADRLAVVGGSLDRRLISCGRRRDQLVELLCDLVAALEIARVRLLQLLGRLQLPQLVEALVEDLAQLSTERLDVLERLRLAERFDALVDRVADRRRPLDELRPREPLVASAAAREQQGADREGAEQGEAEAHEQTITPLESPQTQVARGARRT